MTNTDDSPIDAADESATTESSVSVGVIREFGELGADAIIHEEGLRRLFDRSSDSIKRAVDRGELPPPIRMFGQPTWTAGAIVRHIEERMQQAAEEKQRTDDETDRKMLELSP